MKKHILSFALLLFVITQTKAQTSVYHPFPDSDAVWNINMYYNCVTAGYMYYDFSYVISGDTIINSNTYHKITVPFILIYSSCVGEIFNNNGYQGAIRQDINQKKVFFIPPKDSVAQILYDFNLQVGDTIQGYFGYDCYYQTVAAIDSVLIGNSYRKKWVVDGNINQDYIIEGIGFTWSLLDGTCDPVDGPVYRLTCFKQNDGTLYPDTTTSCEIIDVVSTEYNSEGIIYVSPNPAPNQLTIHTSSFPANEAATVSIMNVLGQEVAHPPTPSLREGEDALIDVSKFATGMYFLQLKTESGSVVKRFVKE